MVRGMRLRLSMVAVVLALLGCGSGGTSGTSSASSAGSTSAGPGGATSSASTGGAGTTGSTGGTGGTTGSTGGAGGTGGGPDVPATCVTMCAAEASFGCTTKAACEKTCAGVLALPGDCSMELAAVDACYAVHTADLTSCARPSACDGPYGDYLVCVDALCVFDPCTDQQGVCSCTAMCASRAVKSVCKGASCDCFVNGNAAGSCSDGSDPICGLKESCCTVLYFLAM